jgi:Uri superfamily endonuclease
VTSEELKEDIAVEIENIETVLQELSALSVDVKGREAVIREKTAASAFLAQFYSGIENILKRISRFYNMTLPSGDMWHIDLFRRFCKPSLQPLPVLFDDSLSSALAPYRKFRHVVHHGYGFQLDWDRMTEGIENAEPVFLRFIANLKTFLITLDS